MDVISSQLIKIDSGQQGRLRIFLGLKTSDTVLVVASDKSEKYESLLTPCDRHVGEIQTWQRNIKYSCLFLDVGRCLSRSSLFEQLKCATDLLADDGILLLLSTNFLVPRFLSTKSHRDNCSTVFLPFPRGTSTTDEFPRINCSMMADYHEYGKMVSVLHRLRLYPLFHNNYLVIKSAVAIEQNRLFIKILNAIEKYLNTKTCLEIERFDARIRGALVVFVLEKKSGKHFIARIITDQKTKVIVSKNQSFLEYLHSELRMPPEIKVIIPQIVDQIEWQGSTTYLENRLQGILAWKLITKQNASIIFNEALQFLHKFNRATETEKKLGEEMWVQMFTEDEIRLQAIPIMEELLKKINSLLKVIKNQFIDRKMSFVASHGDFGYGNILLDSNSLTLTGVIDWDTGRSEDFPVVDLFNLLIQQRRSLGQSLLDAATEIMVQLNSGTIPNTWRSYLYQYAKTKTDTKVFFGISLLRYMSRAAQYESVFFKEQDTYLKLIYRYEDIFCL